MEISVALRKESVDRNACIAGRRVGPGLSLSARRAWIEIQGGIGLPSVSKSLSARRAWIEMG